MELVFSQILDGLSIGSVLLLAATGLAIVFGLMGVINLAHGEFMMLGAYVTFVVQNMFRPLGASVFELYYLVALVASFVVTALVGVLLERTLIRRLYRATARNSAGHLGCQPDPDSVRSQCFPGHGAGNWCDSTVGMVGQTLYALVPERSIICQLSRWCCLGCGRFAWDFFNKRFLFLWPLLFKPLVWATQH